ncbi:MAG: SGNH/GDSL hydrolase family protein [Chloroflexi bacterium]|nr:SGNH/GDSL hydrolase family protein [Chloroflexota bacterium]MCI0730937.1 SGNH/GDSL hydrolase family protein [Chloroflexota bacterium]
MKRIHCRLLRNLGLNLLVACFSLLATLLALEFVFRLLDIRGYYEARTREWDHALMAGEDLLPGVRVQFKPYAQFDFNYDSNPRGYFNENNGLTYQTNRYGFRGPDYETAKPAGTRRVILLGDSFTFGEGVKFEDTLGSQLQTLLGPGVEVLNFGVSAWGTVDEIGYLEQAGVQFQPDLVVVVYVLNDAGYTVDLWENFRSTYENPALRSSYLASYVYATIGRQLSSRQYAQDLVNSALTEEDEWNASFHFLYKGSLITGEAGSNYMVAIFPFMYELNDDYPFRPLHDNIASFCMANDIPVLDLLAAFQGESYPDLWVHPSDQHPNEKGHRIAAEALADFILVQGLLDGG